MVGSDILLEINTLHSYLFYVSMASFSLSSAILYSTEWGKKIPNHSPLDFHHKFKLCFGKRLFFLPNFDPVSCDVILNDIEELVSQD